MIQPVLRLLRLAERVAQPARRRAVRLRHRVRARAEGHHLDARRDGTAERRLADLRHYLVRRVLALGLLLEELAPLVGQQRSLAMWLDRATVYTIGFRP